MAASSTAATAYGGGDDWGFRLSYGDRKGSDYESGNGTRIPSSYHNQDIWGEFSYDLSPYQHIDFAYQRLDQTNTEYPCQFFDVPFMGTYGFETQLVDEDPTAPWTKFVVGGWYNRTWFRGFRSKFDAPGFPVVDRIDFALNQDFGGMNFLSGTFDRRSGHGRCPQRDDVRRDAVRATYDWGRFPLHRAAESKRTTKSRRRTGQPFRPTTRTS